MKYCSAGSSGTTRSLSRERPEQVKPHSGFSTFIPGQWKHNEPGIIITFEEGPEKLYRDSAAFGWDLQALEKQDLLRIIPSSPEAIQQMLLSTESGLSKLTRSIGAGRILVDSITHFRRITDNVQQLRSLLVKFLTSLMQITSSAVLIKEIETGESEGANIEEYIVDTVIRLSYDRTIRHRRERNIEVMKSRGQKHISGRHTLEFEEHGLAVYPVCAALYHSLQTLEKVQPKKMRNLGRYATTGIKGFDQMCGGGFPAGSSSVVAGSSGTGKTVFSCQFIQSGLKSGERALIISFQQSEDELMALGRAFGMSLAGYREKGLLDVIYLGQTSLSVDRLLYELRELLIGEKAKSYSRVAVDGLTHLVQAIREPSYLQDYVESLLSLLRAGGLTSIFTFEVDKMFGSFEIDSLSTLGLFDNLVLMRYVELEGEIRKAMTILKMRGVDHEKSIPEYVISKNGVELLSKFEAGVEVMGGSGVSQNKRLELEDVLADATRWADAARKMRERRER